MAIVSYISKGEMRPVPTDEEFARLCELAEANAVPDSEIDYSDIPPVTDEELAEFLPYEEAIRLRQERRNERQRIAKNLVNSTDLSIDQIAKATMLDPKQIETLALAPAHS